MMSKLHGPGSHPALASKVSRRTVLIGGVSSAAAFLAACSRRASASSAPAAHTSTTSATPTPIATSTPTPSPSPTPAPTGSPVTVSSYLSDGAVVGVGMPIVLSFDPAPTDASAFVANSHVTVNGAAVQGAWYWEKPYADEPVQAHFRLQDYWPANSTVVLTLDVAGQSAGPGLVYGDGLTSVTFQTGDKRVVQVDGAAETAVVMVNDVAYRTMKASLGKSSTPTYTGTKLVMAKGEYVPGTRTLRPNGAVRMQNTAHTYDLIVDWSVRITESGEFLHAAPWNSQIGQTSTSDGCTNLTTTDAEWFYNFARIGDVVIHTNTGGTPVPTWDGFGDWNVEWATWQAGGLLKPT